MLARHFRIAQLFELVAYAAFGTLLHRSCGWTPGEAVSAAIAMALGWRAIAVGLTFLAAWIHRSPRAAEHRIGLAAALRMFVAECRAFTRCTLVDVPWESYLLRADPEPRATDRTPVVLAHGYFANRGYFRRLVGKLEALGVAPIFAPNLRAHRAAIEDYEADLHAAIERIGRGTGRKVVLVGHSMGGLGARAYLAKRGARRVSRLLTIASPHHGSALAAFGSGVNARQMRPGSDFLAALARAEGGAGPEIPALSIHTPHDNMVFPQESSRLAWARNVALPGFGHIDVLDSEKLLEALLGELREAGVVPRP